MKKLLLACLPCLLLGGCFSRNAYYQNPLHTNSSSYKAIPLTSEKINAVTYASGAITTGAANEHIRDGFTAIMGSVHRSHNLGHFQAYYGLNGAWGRYRIGTMSGTLDARFLDDSLINSRSGAKVFGALGAVGGFNVVVPFRYGGEWRVLGTEVSWNHEFGQYLQFRKQLPDSAANLIDRNQQSLSISFSTEILMPVGKDLVGCKTAVVFNPHRINGHNQMGSSTKYSSAYWSNTLHLTMRQVTIFGQLNIGSYAVGLQLGTNVRIGK
jgi:hypothetical protein